VAVVVSRFLARAIGLIFGLAFVAMGVHDLVEQWGYQSNSQVVRGTVLAIEPGKRDNPKSTKVRYEFRTADSRRFQGDDLVSPTTRAELHVGGPVAVQYRVDDPTSNQIDEKGEEWLYLLWIALGPLCILFGFMQARRLGSGDARETASSRAA
jgi:hypothetical protein